MGDSNNKKRPSRKRSRAIRAQMNTTGERYTVAARFVDANLAPTTPVRTRMTMENAELCRMQLLARLYEYRPPQPGLMPDVTDIIDPDQRTAENEAFWRDLLRALDNEGLIKLAETMGFEGTAMMITHAGRVDVEARQARRRDPVRRGMAARDAIVLWLYPRPRHEASDVAPIVDDPNYLFEAQPLTVADLSAALSYLAENELITGTRMFGGSIARPRLTTKGIDCAEQFGGSVSDYLHRSRGEGTQHNVNFNGAMSGNVSWGSEHVTQTATTAGLPTSELQNIVRAIAEALPVLGLPAEQSERVRSDLNALHGELVSEQPDRSVVKKFMTQTATALGAATNSALASILTACVADLMRRAGIPLS